MIVNIPEDIKAYESKNFGNFTGRQVVCLLLALPVIAVVFGVLFTASGSVDLASVAAVFAGLPIIMCGVFKRHGLYLEQIIRYKLEWRFKYPRRRQFVMKNLYEDIIAAAKEEEQRAENQEED